MWARQICFALLFFSTDTVWPGGYYLDPNGSFRINVPIDYRVRTGTDKPGDSYIPVCHADSLVCFEYPAHRYVGTTFSSASIEVTVLAAKTEQSCIDSSKKISEATDIKYQLDKSSPTQKIDGVTFRHYLHSGAAMSHEIESNTYRGFDRGTCFEFSTAVTFTVFAVFDPGQIQEFAKQDKAEVTMQLLTIITSFRASGTR